jgi:hypothetical protein
MRGLKLLAINGLGLRAIEESLFGQREARGYESLQGSREQSQVALAIVELGLRNCC